MAGIATVFLSLFESDDKESKFGFIVGGIVLSVGVFAFSFGLGSMQDKITKLEAPKTYYYDGFKIDVEDVDLREFVITYDPEKDIYTLTRKEN